MAQIEGLVAQGEALVAQGEALAAQGVALAAQIELRCSPGGSCYSPGGLNCSSGGSCCSPGQPTLLSLCWSRAIASGFGLVYLACSNVFWSVCFIVLFLAWSTSLVFAPGLVGTSFLFTVATWVVTFFRFRLVLGPQSQHSKNTDFRQPENTTNNESMSPVLVSERARFVGRFRVPF